MSKFRFVLVGAGAALALAGAGVLANVGAISLTNSDSHGDAVASAARTTCPHGPNGVHAYCRNNRRQMPLTRLVPSPRRSRQLVRVWEQDVR